MTNIEPPDKVYTKILLDKMGRIEDRLEYIGIILYNQYKVLLCATDLSEEKCVYMLDRLRPPWLREGDKEDK